MRTVAAAIHGALIARENCEKSGNREWIGRWEQYVYETARNKLPHGSGIDNGTRVKGLTTDRRGIVLLVEFHHMNDAGMYNGWTYHTVRVRPAFNGLDITIGGPDRNDIKEYLAQVLEAALSAEAPPVAVKENGTY